MFDKKYAMGSCRDKCKVEKSSQRSSFDEKNSSDTDIPLQEIFKDAIRKGNIKTADVREIISKNQIYFRDF